MEYSYFLAEFGNGSEKGVQGNLETCLAYHHMVKKDAKEQSCFWFLSTKFGWSGGDD